MANVIFYEKPGCINNTKQKRLLMDAGHHVDARNLLTQAWTPDGLLPFLMGGDADKENPYAAWINVTHPKVKSGELILPLTDKQALLDLLCADPLLIKRPLMLINGRYFQGFDAVKVDEFIGLSRMPTEDIESCPRTHASAQ